MLPVSLHLHLLLPNVEDINLDNNLSETESYFQYKIELKPQNMVVGTNFITDNNVNSLIQKSGKKQVYWYQFRVPLREFSKKVNGYSRFQSYSFHQNVHERMESRCYTQICKIRIN
jgi:cell surface protein SprA